MENNILLARLLEPGDNRKSRVAKIRTEYNLALDFIPLEKDSDFFKRLDDILQKNDLEVFKHFIAQENIPLNAVLNPYGETLLLMSITAFAANITTYLIENNCLLNYIGSSSYHYKTAIQHTVCTAQFEFLPVLLDKKIELNLLDQMNEHIVGQITKNAHRENAYGYIDEVLKRGFDTKLLNIVDRFNVRPFLMNHMDGYVPHYSAEYNAPLLELPRLIFEASSLENLISIEDNLTHESQNYQFEYLDRAQALLNLLSPILEQKKLSESVVLSHKNSTQHFKI